MEGLRRAVVGDNGWRDKPCEGIVAGIEKCVSRARRQQVTIAKNLELLLNGMALKDVFLSCHPNQVPQFAAELPEVLAVDGVKLSQVAEVFWVRSG